MFYKWDNFAQRRYEKTKKVSFSAYLPNKKRKTEKKILPYKNNFHIFLTLHPSGDVTAEYIDDKPSTRYKDVMAWRNYGVIGTLNDGLNWEETQRACEELSEEFIHDEQLYKGV